MRPPSSLELLEARERGLGQQPIERALTLLAAVCPDTTRETLAELSIGQRDAALLTLREWIFGSRLDALAVCPVCGEPLELSFTVDDVRAGPTVATTDSLSVVIADYELSIRPPNSRDLAVLSADAAPGANRQRLLRRCVLAARRHGDACTAGELPGEVLEMLVARLAEADPQADVHLALTCPACGHRWQTVFDVATFLWSELETWATRLLREIHLLASAYGWREADILALSPIRRQSYLAMVGT